jgi:hypothetical protein
VRRNVLTRTNTPTPMHAIPIHIHTGEPVMKLPLSAPYPWIVQTAPTATSKTPTAGRMNRMPPVFHRRAPSVARWKSWPAAAPGHGAPARLVVPGRRGYWWVKWVTAIDVDDTPWWWQPPFPVT